MEDAVDFPSVYCLQLPPSETAKTTEYCDFQSDSDSSDGEFFDALTGQEGFSLIENQKPWSHEDWGRDGWDPDWDKRACTPENRTCDNTDSQPYEADISNEPDHPLAGWHSQCLIKSDWTKSYFIDKQDHIDFWTRHTENSLPQCTWCTLPIDVITNTLFQKFLSFLNTS